uniref:Putative secreted protein n=1 Tax=Ixodes ricinus TaxID=34613 RepID=A0A6B0UCM0_IXORI
MSQVVARVPGTLLPPLLLGNVHVGGPVDGLHEPVVKGPHLLVQMGSILHRHPPHDVVVQGGGVGGGDDLAEPLEVVGL